MHRFQRGVGIVELMVAMLLGSLVVIGVVQIFTANRQTFRMQDAMAFTQESGTFALDFVARDLLRAGYPLGEVVVDWVNTQDNTVTGMRSDTLAVVYDPEVTGGVYCTGEPTGGVELMSNRYWVNTQNQLVCQGAFSNAGAPFALTGAPQVLVDNVESFQVMYGVDLRHGFDKLRFLAAPAGCVDSPSQANAYINAAQAAAALANGLAPPNADCEEMGEAKVIRTVRIALLLRTPNAAGAIVPPGRTYAVLDTVLGAPAINPADGRLRRLFTKTIMLRNVDEVVR